MKKGLNIQNWRFFIQIFYSKIKLITKIYLNNITFFLLFVLFALVFLVSSSDSSSTLSCFFNIFTVFTSANKSFSPNYFL